MEQFSELVEGLIARPIDVSLLHLVTKQDLWWADRHLVEQYYTSGQFASEVAKLQKRKEKHRFEFERVSVSLSLENLIDTRSNEVLAPLSTGYDQAAQTVNFLEFSNTLSRMAKR